MRLEAGELCRSLKNPGPARSRAVGSIVTRAAADPTRDRPPGWQGSVSRLDLEVDQGVGRLLKEIRGL